MVFAESYGGSGCRSRESVAGRSGSGRERDAADEELNSSRHVASMSLTDNASVRGEENGNGVGDSVGGDANANDPGAAVRSLQSGLHGEDLLELQMLENRGTQRHKDGSSSLGWEEEELVVGPGSTHRAAPSRTSGLEKSSENEMFVSPLSTGSFPEDPPLDSRSSSDPNQHRLKESIGLGLESPALTEDHPDPSAQKSTVVNGSVEKASNAAGSDAQEPGNPSEEPQVINDEDPTQESTHQLHQSFSADSETNMDQNEDARVKISKISAVDPAGPEASSEKAPRTKERPRPSQTPSSPKVSPQKKPPCSPAGARRPFVSGLRQPSKSFLTGFAPQKVMTSLTPRLPPQRSSSADASRSSSRLQEPRGGTFSPSRLVRTPRHTLPKRPDAKPERSHGDEHKHHTHEADKGGSPAPSCFSKAPRPQLGLDPVKVRGQRSASPADLRKSRLRPPGFSHLLPARLAAFGFVRSGSVSSLSSNQSNDSSRSRVNSDSEDSLVSLLLRSAGCGPQPRPPPLSPARRSALPPPASPLASRKDLQRSREISSSPLSSPKRLTCPGGQRSGVEPLVRRLKVKCDEQEHQMSALREKLRKASLCLDVFIISTAHFSHKSETAALKETELLQLIVKIRDEAAAGVERLERLRVEKVRVEQMFDQELKELQQKQQQELTLTRQSLEEEKSTQTRRLHQQLDTHLQELTAQHHAQMEVLSEGHQASLMEMEATHQDTLKTLQEEHARTVTNLKMAHQQQKSSMQEEFEKLRLSLQDQVDTLTFQNRALRDRAKRFEEALRRSTDEQILDALAPYQHIEEDLKSLKEVVEMKNQQIHQQEQKISELEKMAQKNVLLEEQMKLLQQKNEDLKDRIDRNLAASRQLSEENANLQVHVEKESSEKKRLSRTNEELLWRLQTGEISPAHSPLHRPHSGPASPR